MQGSAPTASRSEGHDPRTPQRLPVEILHALRDAPRVSPAALRLAPRSPVRRSGALGLRTEAHFGLTHDTAPSRQRQPQQPADLDPHPAPPAPKQPAVP